MVFGTFLSSFFFSASALKKLSETPPAGAGGF
jgi:hypothetical protein